MLTTNTAPTAMLVLDPNTDAYRMGDGEGTEWLNDSAWAEVFEARAMLSGWAWGSRCDSRLLPYHDADITALCFA